MIQTARMPAMDAFSGSPRPDFAEDSAGSGGMYMNAISFPGTCSTTCLARPLTSPSAEGRVRKRLQRERSENDDPSRKPGLSLPFSRSTVAPSDQKPQASHARRRSTLMQNKGSLLGPRPLENSKRCELLLNDHMMCASADCLRVASSSISSGSNPPPSYFPPNGEPTFSQPSTGSNPRFSFSQAREPAKSRGDSGSSDFLPSVNFDDFHARLTYNPDLNSFPTPNGMGKIQLDDMPTGRMNVDRPRADEKPAAKPTKPKEEPKSVSRSNSLVRRFSNARKHNTVQTDNSMPPPSGPLGSRSRRQSSITSAPQQNTGATRAPRKSVGPGLLTQARAERAAQRESTATASTAASIARSSSVSKGRRETLAPNMSAPNEQPRMTTTARNLRTKSLQPPPKDQGQGHLSVQSLSSGVNGDASPAQNARSPGRSPAHRTHTPSSSGSKRQSTVHVGGLGARTISPTDARRLKRLSTAASKQPAVPQLPLTPQPDYSHVHATARSPAVPRKSVTPSSSRNTPDFARANALGMSMSSTSSVTSLQRAGPNGGTSSRNSQVMSSSRLPTPKPRNVHSSAGMLEEEVPPVPAIPKAYESPKDLDQIQQQYFSPRSNQIIDVDQMNAQRSARKESVARSSIRKVDEPQPVASTASQDASNQQNPRHRRGLTVGSGSGGQNPPPAANTQNKRNQPLMLPPLNLLPLGTPANNRIASFPAPSKEVDGRGHATPPPKRGFTKTPSTPMTASKASFFSRNRLGDEDDYHFQLRSSSSHHLLRSDDVSSHYGLISPTTPVAIPSPITRHGAPTPFSSNSLPKEGGDFSHLLTGQADDYTYDHRVNADMVRASMPDTKPSLQLKKDTPSTRTSISEEPSTPASTTSLRRKLSFSWKRSSSKASKRGEVAAAQNEKDDAKQAQHKGMPPPRLPASATWNTMSNSPHETQSARPSLDGRFRKSSNSVMQAQIDAENTLVNGLYDGGVSKSEETMPPPPSYAEHRRVASRSSSSSLLNPMQRMLGGRSSQSTLKARNLDTNLDKDDLVADKMMEKMASKRKDFEQAAKDVDELRRRAVPREKMSPIAAIQANNLNIFERGEIIDYKEVFFCGTPRAKKLVGDLDASSNNFGYDDDRGDYNIILGDHLAYRYEVVDVLGKGSFGQVVRCIDHKTGQLVAVKIIRNKKRFHQQALVEVNILQRLREWVRIGFCCNLHNASDPVQDPDNRHSMISFTQSFYFRGHLCISTELLGMNLYEFIKAYEFKGFPLQLIRRFTKQMLSALILLQSRRVIHCDLKPENILLAHPMHSEIKVIDFGSSCFENEKVYTYIQSRFYRSPEVILGMSYGIAIDMWSLGCILAELLTGYPIFPGENEQEQLACIMEIFGPPERGLIEKSSRKKLFFDSMGKPRVTVSSKGRRRRPSSKTLGQALKCDDEAFLDFIARCLRWDPERRLKPDEAMHHEFITGIKPKPTNNPRVRAATGATATAAGGNQNSPIKRFNTVQTPLRNGVREASAGSRPLPEPPVTSFRNGNPVHGHRDASMPVHPSSSPVKGRRHSAFNTVQGGTGVKRASNGMAVASSSNTSLPRVAGATGVSGRSVSGKPDLASAAAAASLSASIRGSR